MAPALPRSRLKRREKSPKFLGLFKCTSTPNDTDTATVSL